MKANSNVLWQIFSTNGEEAEREGAKLRRFIYCNQRTRDSELGCKHRGAQINRISHTIGFI